MSCKSCGREIPEGQEYCGECLFAALPVIKKKKKWKKALRIVGAAVLGIIVIATSLAFVLSIPIRANEKNPEPLVTTISEVIAAYNRNKLKAYLLYSGRWLQITGQVGEEIELGGESFLLPRIYELGYEADPYSNESMYAEVLGGRSELKLQPGEVVTVKGRCEGRFFVIMGNAYFAPSLHLYNCVIVPDPAES